MAFQWKCTNFATALKKGTNIFHWRGARVVEEARLESV